MLKILLLVCFFHAAESGSWKYLGYGCVGARGNQYLELLHPGPSPVFMGAMKLVHTSGFVGCRRAARSNWGCRSSDSSIFMAVTDLNNQLLYPSPRLFKTKNPGKGGEYELPGYTSNSPELIFADFGNPQYLKKGEKIRIWYSEDLYGYTEHDNHGKTCMYVYVYSI